MTLLNGTDKIIGITPLNNASSPYEYNPKIHSSNIQSESASSASAFSNSALSSAESLLNTQLACALSTISDSKYFEDVISPSTVRIQLSSYDPCNHSSSPDSLKGMKWLLACISRGRNVSDFFPHVVKLVSSSNLELRKMVYVFLVHYADHDSLCRELSLLSINSFQRGLADSEQWIRALALRVLSSIRVMDVLHIQILAVQKCARDESPYVRKCAANAVAKLFPHAMVDEKTNTIGSHTDNESLAKLLIDVMVNLLEHDNSTMVLSSSMMTFSDICPERLDLLHTSYCKLCHLLIDMDEWGQVIVMDVLSRYCRKYFTNPNRRRVVSSELVDEHYRVVRRVLGVSKAVTVRVDMDKHQLNNVLSKKSNLTEINLPIDSGKKGIITKVKKRIVKTAFYSDEEDESIETVSSICSMDALDNPSAETKNPISSEFDNFGADINRPLFMNECNSVYDDIDKDHSLLLRSSFHLLRSRNSAVVLAVCSLHYYCGIANVKIRSAIGKALVRIYHDRREIQYIVLSSIQTLVWECPSAFMPYLSDFFVKAMDPSFTRRIKLDILAALALDPNSINIILKELQSYIRHDDKNFVCASIETMGNVTEMARIVFDRCGKREGNALEKRNESNVIALNCLNGLTSLSQLSDDENVVGECVVVMQRILSLLRSECPIPVIDHNAVQISAMKILLLLVITSLLSSIEENDCHKGDFDTYTKNSDTKFVTLMEQTVHLNGEKIVPALWILGEWLNKLKLTSVPIESDINAVDKKIIRSELLRVLAKSFTNSEPGIKNGSVHFASKIFIDSHVNPNDSLYLSTDDIVLCEYILALGRVDINHDVRDRSRHESLLLHLAIGLRNCSDSFPTIPTDSKITKKHALDILLGNKPSSSWIPIEDMIDENTDGNSRLNNPFRFGTLSSIILHKAGKNKYIPLPQWAEENSSNKLRQSLESNFINPKKKFLSLKGFENVMDKQSDNLLESFDDSVYEESAHSLSSRSSLESSHTYVTNDSSNDNTSDIIKAIADFTTSNNDLYNKNGSALVADQAIVLEKNTQSSLTKCPPNLSNTLLLSQSFSDCDNISSSQNRSNLDLITGIMDVFPSTSSSKTTKQGTNSDVEGYAQKSGVFFEKNSCSSVMIEEESSMWKQLVRPELSGGLAVFTRYLRSSTRNHELKNLGLDPSNPSVICIQLKFENRRSDGVALRRIKLMHHVKHGTCIALKHCVTPQEISMLNASDVSLNVLGLEFTEMSDKDKAMTTRFDIKSDRGISSVDICLPLGELIHCISMDEYDFDNAIEKLNNMHHRTRSSFSFNRINEHLSLKSQYSTFIKGIHKHADLGVVGDFTTWLKNKIFKLSGKLIASGLYVLLTVAYSPTKSEGELVLFCDDELVLNSLMDFFKFAMSTIL